ncbi:MAG TPA: iron uptake porin [Nostocaceae cyanobacterium]|nr:iron uptake porin [Nostocaceae cyanobacterium]
MSKKASNSLPSYVLPWLIFAAINSTGEQVKAQEYPNPANPQTQQTNFNSAIGEIGAQEYKNTAGTQVQQSIESETSINANSAEYLSLEADSQPLAIEEQAQVTSVSQLEDVQPTDWAFQALQSLVERYGCISGYPDSTFRGNRAITRYEFAAGLEACLQNITTRIGLGQESGNREDLETIQRLQSEFSAELATLRGRVDSLEARTTELEANQFSTTTKFNGTLILGLNTRGSNRGDINPRGDGIKDTDDLGTNTILQSKSVLSLFTQFAPRNFLITNIRYMNGSTLPRFNPNPSVINAVSNNDVILSYEYPAYSNPLIADLFFNWQVSDNLAVKVGTAGMDMINHFRGLSRVDGPPTGTLSRFGLRNPIINTGFGQGGIAFDWQMNKNASLQALYSSNTASLPTTGNGLFDGNTTIGLQLLVSPSKDLDVAFQYINNYSRNGCMLTFVGDDCLTGVDLSTSAPLQTNAFGGSLNWQITKGINLGGWGGYTTSSIPGSSGTVETTNYMVYLNFPDLFGRGNLGGIYFGQPPKIVSSDLPVGNNVPDLINGGTGRAGGQPGTTLHLEAFYRMRVSDNISITPGIIHIIEPGHTPNSDPVTMGILRTTFLF